MKPPACLRWLLLLGAALLTACGQGLARSGNPAGSRSAAPLELGDLPRSKPVAGQCLLVLWSRSAEPRQFFAATDQGQARLQLGSRTLELRPIPAHGPAAPGLAGTRRYRGDGHELTLGIGPDTTPALQDGAVIRDAVVEVREPSGWSRVFPASGLVACGHRATPIK